MNRNNLCPCGSGKRYKRCCGLIAAATRPAAAASDPAEVIRRDPVGTLLHEALLSQKEGRLASSEALYNAVLQAMPGHFDALHMLGVVKLQLGKVEDATQLLLTALPFVPDGTRIQFKHNLALCLMGLGIQRGVLATLAREPPELLPPAPFVRAYAIPDGPSIARECVSVIVTDAVSAPALARTLEGIRGETVHEIEVVVVVPCDDAEPESLREILDRCGLTASLIVADDPSLIGQVNAATAACSGGSLCFLRAGDRWAPQWLTRMTAAMQCFGAQWGYSGLRIIADDGSIVRFGAVPDADALLRAQDDLYLHRTPSLAFLSFNPIAVGRNLIVRSALWRNSGGCAANASDPFLDWGWRTVQCEEPVYLDEPAYLIPAGTESLHLHDSRAQMIGATARAGRSGSDQRPWPEGMNRHLEHGVARFWARQWQLIRALKGSAMSSDVLRGCAAMLGVKQNKLALPFTA